jgi:putative nucleotidyltransferase with HDIG domain
VSTIDSYIDRVEHLPPAPTVAIQLLGLFNDPDRELDRIVELISHDPSLTAEVLRLCNSAVFAAEEPASDMFEAITRLGFYEVYCLVAGLIGARAMAMGKVKGGLDVGALWRHSVTTAIAAATLAQRVQQSESSAFTAGLLHDLGKLVFAAVEGAQYSELVGRTPTTDGALVQAEEATWKVTHASLGARLLIRWGFPAEVALPVLLHHDSPIAAGRFESLAGVVHLGNLLAHQMADGKSEVAPLPLNNSDAMNSLRLSPEDMPGVVEQAQARLQQTQGLLQMAL